MPNVFRYLQETGNVEEQEMLRSFNMGQGFLFAVAAEQAEKALETLTLTGQQGTVLGKIIGGKPEVLYDGCLQYA